jgi:pyruvate-ferredoxin/flavodoxin oxidoreductase
LLSAEQKDEAGIFAQRERVARLVTLLATLRSESAQRLAAIAEYLVKKSVWLVGGDAGPMTSV